ncbi:MAG: hypothetical protein QXN15_08630 [Candidatus Jordarchaeales archaeon]|nr:hypothetical protein [Candidatus Jordarchaeia archaeon]
MMHLHWLARLVKGVSDEGLHRRFVKYSVGVFDGPRLEVTVKGKNMTLKGDFGYEDLISWFALSLMSEDEECAVSGVVLGKPCAELLKDYGGKPEVKGDSYKVKVNFSFRAGELRRIYERYSDECTFLLSIKTARGWNVKCRTKLDWTVNVRGEEEGVRFCVGKIVVEREALGRLLEQAIPDFISLVPQGFKNMLITNEFVVEELVAPENREGLTARELRLMSKRRGKVKRTLNVDGETFHNEVGFMV